MTWLIGLDLSFPIRSDLTGPCLTPPEPSSAFWLPSLRCYINLIRCRRPGVWLVTGHRPPVTFRDVESTLSHVTWTHLTCQVRSQEVLRLIAFAGHCRGSAPSGAARKVATRRRRYALLQPEENAHFAAVRCPGPLVQVVGHLKQNTIQNMEILSGIGSGVNRG